MEAFSRKKSPMGLEQTINFQRKLTHPSPPIPRMHKRAKLTESDINFPAPEIENPFVRPLNPQTEIKEEEKSPPKAQGSWKMSFHLLKAHLSPKYIPLFNPINIENVVNRHIPKYSLFDGANGVKEEGGSSQGGIYNQYSSNSIMGSFCVSGSNSSLPTQYSISAFPSRMAPKKVSVNSNNPEENSKKPRIQTNTHSFMPQKVNALHFEPRVVQLNGEVQIPSYPNCNYRVALPNNMLKVNIHEIRYILIYIGGRIRSRSKSTNKERREGRISLDRRGAFTNARGDAKARGVEGEALLLEQCS